SGESFCAPSQIKMGAPLILKRVSGSRSSGEWNDDDFDVLADGAVVGRIMKMHAAPEGSLWMWTLAFGHQHTAVNRRARLLWRRPPSHGAPRGITETCQRERSSPTCRTS